MENGFFYGKLPTEDIRLNPAELAARLQTEKGFSNELIEKCEGALRSAMDCRYTARKIALSFPQEDVVDLGFARAESHSLYRNLKGCGEGFVMAVTIGIGTERLLNRLSLLSNAEHFITDALASAAVEAVCDRAEEIIKGDLVCRPRFSPGYGDLSLEIQPKLLAMVEGQKLLGITLSNSLLMSPMKSITAIMGVCHEEHPRRTEE